MLINRNMNAFRHPVVLVEAMLFFLVISCLSVQIVNSADTCCSSGLCKCDKKGKYVDCSNRSLNYIPTLPGNIIALNFTNNLLEKLNHFTLSNVTSKNISTLTFKNNKIFAFDDALGFTNLKKLDLSFNPIPDISVPDLFKYLNNSKIKYLILSHTGLSVLPKNFCQGRKLEILDLSYNNLKTVNISDMKQCSFLRNLIISRNKISELIGGELDYIFNLDVSRNKLIKLPDLCENPTNFPNLQNLNFFNNSIATYEPEKISCLKKLQSLRLQGNYITYIPMNSFNRLPDLSVLVLGSQKNKEMLIFQPWAINNSHLNSLSINSAYLSTLDPKALYGCSNIKYLNLSNNSLSSNLSALSTLQKLRVLKVYSNHFKSIPSVIVENLHRLELLDMSGNAIQSWNASTFNNSVKLNRLYFGRNLIQTVTKEMFPLAFQKQLQKIDLSDNPFACTCEMVWLVQWMQKESKKFVGYPQSYHCLNITMSTCSGGKNAFVSLILGLSACIIIILGVVLLYKYRTELTDQ